MTTLPKLSREDIEKVERLKGQHKSSVVVTPEMYFLAEFGYYFGWEAVVAIENDVISLEKAQMLLEAARKVWYSKMYEQSLGNHYASRSSKAFSNGMSTFLKKAEVK